MDLEEIGINTRNWVDLAQVRDYWRALVNAALNLRVLYAMELVNSSKSLSFCIVVTLSLRPCSLPFMTKRLTTGPTDNQIFL